MEKNNNKINEQQAREVIDRVLKVLYYRDGRAYDKVNRSFNYNWNSFLDNLSIVKVLYFNFLVFSNEKIVEGSYDSYY